MKNVSNPSSQGDELRPCLAVDLPVSDYQKIHQKQLDAVAAKYTNQLDRDIIFVLEHYPVFTIGRNGDPSHLIAAHGDRDESDIPVLRIERGGEITYHGPGQIVGYPIVDLKRSGLAVKSYMAALEEIMIRTAADFGVTAKRKAVNPGIWVADRKLGSVGVAVRHGIAFHGFALNVNLSLAPFERINPCGLTGVQMTSLEKETGALNSLKEVRRQVWHHLAKQLHYRLNFEDGVIEQWASQTDSHRLNEATVRRVNGQTGNRVHPKPKWLRRRLSAGPAHEKIRNLIQIKGLHTVCQQAKCPNQFECFSRQTATFLILGDRCSRDCGFCNVKTGPIQSPDPDEPGRIAEAASKMKLQYVVVTSVTRDDLLDGGAAHFAETIAQLRKAIPDIRTEVLIPDFQGDAKALQTVLSAGPDVLNHNIETVTRLYPQVRPQADYKRSLELLRRVNAHKSQIPTKSGLMLGLGETNTELEECLHDIFNTGCRILTMGQYLQPSPTHLPVARFIPPEEFDSWREVALNIGFENVASGPFVRSSYHAKELHKEKRDD